MCDICNILMVVPADQKLWFKCILGHSEPFSFLKRGHTPPEWASREKIMTRELVYYILSGTPKATQKYFWSNPRVKFSGENHLFFICGKMPNQTLWITKYWTWNRSEFYPMSKYLVSCKVWFGIFPQIKKRGFSPKNSTLRFDWNLFWVALGVPDNM